MPHKMDESFGTVKVYGMRMPVVLDCHQQIKTALMMGKRLGMNPMTLAHQIVKDNGLTSFEVKAPGFIVLKD